MATTNTPLREENQRLRETLASVRFVAEHWRNEAAAFDQARATARGQE